MEKKNRIEYIDIAKAIAIFCVVLGHTVFESASLKTVLYSFHMPLFFVLSGMVMQRKDDMASAEYLKRKAYALLIPYFVWGFIYARFSVKSVIFLLYGTREALLRAASQSSLWFLPVLFLAVLIAQTFIQKLENPRYKAGCVVLLFTLGFSVPHFWMGDPFGIDIALVAAGFILLGNVIKDRVSGKMWAAFPVCLLALTVGIYFNAPRAGFVLMGNADYGDPLLFLLGSLGGTGLIILLAYFANFLPKKRLLVEIGQNTLGIFLLHKPIVEFAITLCGRFSVSRDNVLAAILISLVSMMLAFGASLIIRKIVPLAMGEIKREA